MSCMHLYAIKTMALRLDNALVSISQMIWTPKEEKSA